MLALPDQTSCPVCRVDGTGSNVLPVLMPHIHDRGRLGLSLTLNSRQWGLGDQCSRDVTHIRPFKGKAAKASRHQP